MKKVGLETIKTYRTRPQNAISQYIVTHTILDLCMAAEWRPGVQVPMRRWEEGKCLGRARRGRRGQRRWVGGGGKEDEYNK